MVKKKENGQLRVPSSGRLVKKVRRGEWNDGVERVELGHFPTAAMVNIAGSNNEVMYTVRGHLRA